MERKTFGMISPEGHSCLLAETLGSVRSMKARPAGGLNKKKKIGLFVDFRQNKGIQGEETGLKCVFA